MKPDPSFWFFVCLLFWTGSSFAFLGDKKDSLSDDQKALGAAAAQVDQSSSCYSVHRFVWNNTAIHEYVDRSSDKIFAVTYSGTHKPSESLLLGSYADEFHQASLDPTLTTRTSSRHMSYQSVKSAHLSGRSSQRQRHVVGSLVLSDQVPACAKLSEIQP